MATARMDEQVEHDHSSSTIPHHKKAYCSETMPTHIKRAAGSRVSAELTIGVFGVVGVGKTCIVHRFTTGQFRAESDHTIGAGYHAHEVEVGTHKLNFKIFDVSEGEKGITFVPTSFSNMNMDAAIFVYDVTDKDSLTEIEHALNKGVTQLLRSRIIFLVGNKADLAYNSEVFQAADAVAKEWHLGHGQLSAKTAMGVNDVFYHIGECVLEKRKKSGATSGSHDNSGVADGQHEGATAKHPDVIPIRKQQKRTAAFQKPRHLQQSVYHARTVLLGDSAVGKSSILLRLAKGEFNAYQEPTIGAAFASHKIALEDICVRLEIWDTAGQERYISLAPMYYRGAKAAVIVYDITKQDSFKRAQYWVKEQQRYGEADVVLVLAGNKADLEDSRAVPYEEAEDYAEENGLLFYETSAKHGSNIAEMFTKTAELVAMKSSEPNPEMVDLERDIQYRPFKCSACF